MRAWRKLWLFGCLCTLAAPALAEQFALESLILSGRSGKALGGSKKVAALDEFFKTQKDLVFATLNDLGIDINTLPPTVRAKLARYHTTNFEAFRLFSQGLDAQDGGRFAEAKALFRQAVALDPNFELANELSFSMPDTTATSELQLQAVLSAATQSASSSGKTRVEVDVSGALSALQSGQSLVLAESAEQTMDTTDLDYTSNEAGSGGQFGDRKVVGFSYRLSDINVGAAATGEWALDQVVQDSNRGLVSFGDAGDFLARRNSAQDNQLGELSLRDGSLVSWGEWLSSGSNSFEIASAAGSFANLAPEFQYMIGKATHDMPSSGTVSFSPAGGFLNNVSGTIAVNFVNRTVQLNNLGFGIGSMSFSGLQGSTSYAPGSSLVGFQGNYSAGSCQGCAAFSPQGSSYTGNFLGVNADGLMFSTVMATGDGTESGVHLFRGN